MMLNGSADSIRPVAEAALSGGERLYWVGSPNPMNAARRNLSRPLFGLFWTAMVYFMYTKFALSKSFTGDFSIIFKLILAAFFLVGIGMVLSPAWNYIKARYNVYAITDERAMIIRRQPKQTVQSYSIRNMENIKRHGSDREAVSCSDAKRLSSQIEGLAAAARHKRWSFRLGSSGLRSPARPKEFCWISCSAQEKEMLSHRGNG